jgi:hypothetical protein
MNFYKRKIIFIVLIQFSVILSLFVIDQSVPRINVNYDTSAGVAVIDTLNSGKISSERVLEKAEDKEVIRAEDPGTPATLNVILYLIYKLTFKNVN